METTVAEEVQDGVYVTVERFSEITGLPPDVIKKLIREDALPAFKDKWYRIHKEDGLAALRKLHRNGD